MPKRRVKERRRQALEFKRLMQRHGGQKRLPSAASRATDRQRDTFEPKEEAK